MSRVGLLASILLVWTAADAAAQKTDVVFLRNGDRFTGEVKGLSRGQLRLSTDDAGTLYIEWDKIVSLRTAGRYEVTTAQGALHVGMFAPDTSASVRLIAEDGSSTALAFADIVSFSSIKAGFVERIDGTIDLGGSYTKSSGVGQVSLALDATYRRPRYDIFTDFDASLTTQRDEANTSRYAFQAGYTHFRANRWVTTPFAFIESNPDLGLDLRAGGALTFGRFLHQSGNNVTLLAAGIAAGKEQPTEGEAVGIVDALATFATSFYRHDYPRRNFDLSVMVFPELSDWGRLRANLRSKVRQELFKDFLATVTLYDTYDSRPPAEDVHSNDFGVTLSLGWSF